MNCSTGYIADAVALPPTLEELAEPLESTDLPYRRWPDCCQIPS